MGWRFQHQGLAAAHKGHAAEKFLKCLSPSPRVLRRQIVRVRQGKRLGEIAGRKQSFIGRASPKTQQRKLVFLGRLRPYDHAVLGALQLAAGPRQCASLGENKMMGVQAGIGRWVAKPVIGAEQIVEQCRSGSPKSQNDDGALGGGQRPPPTCHAGLEGDACRTQHAEKIRLSLQRGRPWQRPRGTKLAPGARGEIEIGRHQALLGVPR
jgi:hypothetical protein